VPGRAALATGRYLHEVGYWDNVDAYDGRVPSWHHVLRAHGHEVVSAGKLHYRGWKGDDYGFTESLLPMHIHEGRGEIRMLLRDPPGDIGDGSNLLRSAQPGEGDRALSAHRCARQRCRRLSDGGAGARNVRLHLELHARPQRPGAGRFSQLRRAYEGIGRGRGLPFPPRSPRSMH
jgi:hypothetical protein